MSDHVPFLPAEDDASVNIARIIDECVPTEPDLNNRMVFMLCRRTKALPEYKHKSAHEVMHIFWSWWEMSGTILVSEDRNEADVLADFERCWTKIRPTFNGQFDAQSYRNRAMAMPEHPAKRRICDRYRNPEVIGNCGLLLSACQIMQDEVPGDPFALTVRQAAEIIGATGQHSAKAGSRYLSYLIDAHVLECVEKGTDRKKNPSLYRIVS